MLSLLVTVSKTSISPISRRPDLLISQQRTGSSSGTSTPFISTLNFFGTETQLKYDVALLRLESPLTLDSQVWPAKLAKYLPAAGDTVFTAGWGVTSSQGLTSNSLMFVDLPFVGFSTCQTSYKNLVDGLHICAGGVVGKSSCFGDSGSPLFMTPDIQNPTNVTVIGITSYGESCGENVPVIYASVPGFAGSWIKKQIRTNPLCQPDCYADYQTCAQTQPSRLGACRFTRKKCLSRCIIV